jgi:hypothetical protein
MTCGGIIFMGGLFIGAIWLSDEVGSVWPLWVAGAIFVSLIAWRFFEYFHQRGRIKRLDAIFEKQWRDEQNKG